jgi:hypothetical protein
MDLTTVTRTIARLEYAVVRLPFGLLEDCVVTRYWDEDAPIRDGFEYLLGSLDEFAGQLLDDEEICRRGQALKRETGFPPPAGPAPGGSARPEDSAGPETATPWARAAADDSAGPETASPWAEAATNAPTTDAPTTQSPTAAAPGTDSPTTQSPTAGAPGTDSPTAGAPGTDSPGTGEPANRPPDAAVTSAAPPGTVDVVFTLPADVGAERVALCGDFNDWSTETIECVRAGDGSWQATVALEPGRSYRYRYLLDGERWENGDQADGYEPNPYGGADSVVVVE